jgi:uroporphyrinogen decarboxylase
MELFHDIEIRDAIAARFGLTDGLDRSDPDFEKRKYIAVQQFCGFDYVYVSLSGVQWQFDRLTTDDTATLARQGGRFYTNEHTGPLATWEGFDAYPWPDPSTPSATRDLEWYEKNLPEDMCIIAGGTGHFCELLSWLMGYESLCFALYDQRDLVEAIHQRVLAFHRAEVDLYLQFNRVRAVWGSDDMGFKTGLLISPDDTRRLVLSGHKQLAAVAHAAGRPYLLHSCGNLSDIMEDLIDDVGIDGKHSFEDTIEDVRDAKRVWGKRIALIGGIDVDFLCRSDESAIRQRVRDTLDVCHPGGGYCLGTGNSVANYIPLDHYLAMVDEGMRYGG